MNTQPSCSRLLASCEMGPSSRAAESSLRCCNCIVLGTSVRQRPDRKPTLLRESINSIRGTFAYELLNMRYAIGEMDQGEREGQTAILSEARALTLMVSDSFARDAGANRIFCCIDAALCCALDTS